MNKRSNSSSHIEYEKDFNDVEGLSEKEVEERKRKGFVNKIPEPPARSFGEILRANLFTRFNALNLILAGLVILAGSPRNALFAGVILTNTLVGIIQEVRAKKTIEKLSLLNIAKVKVIRGGKEETVNLDETVIHDVMILDSGSQLVADAKIIGESEFEVDESMLTGESDHIPKKCGDELLSGSFIVSGNGFARVTAVGGDTYAAKLSHEAKKFKLIHSELQEAINKVLKVIIWLIIPIGTTLMATQLIFAKRSWQDAIIGAVAGIIGMVPEGLVLLISLTFVVGIVRLSKWNTLVQELPATEVLARVDVLCIDKTGTITEGALKVVDVVILNEREKKEIDNAIAAISNSFPSANPTMQSLKDRYALNPKYEVIDKIPFASDKKYSAVVFKDYGGWVIGAPEMILKEEYDEIRDKVEEAGGRGQRVLLLAKLKDNDIYRVEANNVDKEALILIEDVVRKEAPKTLDYFNEQGVEVKVISGDNPVTVSAVAKKAGVKNYDKYIDARNLPEDDDELFEVLNSNSVFGRVTPYQKKKFVNILQKHGSTVAMTGDGVNDVLALKEADCGIAMASGSDATKAVAQLVLLDSNFSSLPEVVAEGRKMINNLERCANLYLTKTIYSVALALIFALILKPYPVMPIQLSLVGSVAIGIPSFFLALGPNTELVKKGFLKRVLENTVPNGLVVTASVLSMFLVSLIAGLTLEESRTLATFVLGGVSLMILFRVSKPLNLYKIILVVTMFGLFILGFTVPIAGRLFMFSKPHEFYIIIAIGIIAASLPVTEIIHRLYLLIKKDKKAD